MYFFLEYSLHIKYLPTTEYKKTGHGGRLVLQNEILFMFRYDVFDGSA